MKRNTVENCIIFAVWVALFVLIASTASGNDCYIAQRQVAYYVQPVYVAPLVYYSAGQNLIAEANVEKIAQRVYQLQQQRQQSKTAAVQAPAQRFEQAQERFSVLAAKCAKCHSGPNPKAGLIIDGKTEMLCHQITQSIRAIRDDHMPLDRPLSAAEKPIALEELLALESRLPPSDAPARERPREGNDLPPPVEPLRPRQDGNLQ
jgi:cytochrome c5